MAKMNTQGLSFFPQCEIRKQADSIKALEPNDIKKPFGFSWTTFLIKPPKTNLKSDLKTLLRKSYE